MPSQQHLNLFDQITRHHELEKLTKLIFTVLFYLNDQIEMHFLCCLFCFAFYKGEILEFCYLSHAISNKLFQLARSQKTRFVMTWALIAVSRMKWPVGGWDNKDDPWLPGLHLWDQKSSDLWRLRNYWYILLFYGFEPQSCSEYPNEVIWGLSAEVHKGNIWILMVTGNNKRYHYQLFFFSLFHWTTYISNLLLKYLQVRKIKN